MPLTVRNSSRRRRKTPEKKLPERPEEATSSAAARVMAPMRMKLRARRHDNAPAAAQAGGDREEEEEEPEEGGRSRGSGRRRKAPDAAAAAPDASWSPPASVRAAMAAAEEASPDSKCPICLDRFTNLAHLDRCLHRFCFPCIREWSRSKAECPLCKQPFASILHSVRGEDDFKEYTLRPPPANSSVAATVAMVAAMASAARSDHQMRLMLRRHRGADGGEAAARRRWGGGGGGRRAGVWEWYLDTPPLTLPPLPRHPDVSPVAAEDSEEGEEPGEGGTRGGADPTERGVIFEGLTGLGGAAAPDDRAARRLMTRLAARRRLQREGGAVRRLRERETVAFRRALYRNAVRVAAAGNHGQQRDITAESFRRNPSHLNRLRPWLRRELTVLYGAHGSLVDIVQRIIMARVARHGLEDTPTIEEELRQFLLARTDHFLHELVSFARSPLSLESYDLQAAYEPPAAAVELDGTSSSSDVSSVIAISEEEEEEEPAGGGGAAERPAACGARDDALRAGSGLGTAAWDDETPGPSYSTADAPRSLASPPLSHAPREEADEEGGAKEEECLIVGYKKPIAERTPELVQLSSDTEEEEEEEEPPRLPPPAPPLSYLPTMPPSTSGEPKERDSWSGGSGNSVCALSPAAPDERERRPAGDGKSGGGEMAREKRKKRRKKRRSGTLSNPNRSIYPAMMRHRSHSSSPDSTWEFHCAQVSPLTSSPSRCSSSSFSSSSSPPPAPTPSLSPDGRRGEKPGGKRKYKSRHLDGADGDPSRRPGGEEEARRRRESGGRRADRSPSVEIVYEGVVSPDASRTPARERRRKRRRGIRRGSSPLIITLDSDSSLDAAGSSSPISSQQTVDFSDLPALPSVRSGGGGGALGGAEIGELPVDILDRGSEGSEVADGDRDVDVENLEESGFLLNDDEGPMGAAAANPKGSRPMGEKDAAANPPEALSSDGRLLASILDDLKGNFDPGFHRRGAARPADRKRRFDSPASRTEVKEAPPLLKQASPVRSYNRNTPPPLKHKDAGSPRRSPAPSSRGAADLKWNPVGSEGPSSTPRRRFARGDPAAASGASADVVRSRRHLAPVDSPSARSELRARSASSRSHLEFNPAKLHSEEISSSGLSDSHPANSSPAFDFHSTETGWSNQKPAADSTSSGLRGETGGTPSRPVAPVDLHPTSAASAGDTGGVHHDDAPPPALVSPVDFRTRIPSSPVDSHSPSEREGRLPSTGSSVEPVDVHPGPRSTVDLHSSRAAAGELTDVKVSSLANHGAGWPCARLAPVDVHCPFQPVNVHSSSTTTGKHLRRTSLSSATIDALSEHGVSIGARSKPLHLRNHFDPRSRFSIDAHSELGVPIDALSEPEHGLSIDARSKPLHLRNHFDPRSRFSIDARSELGVPIDALSEPEHGVSIDALSEHGVPIDTCSKPLHLRNHFDPRSRFSIDARSELGVPIDSLLEHGLSIDALSEHGVPIDALSEPEHGVSIDALSEPELGVPNDALSEHGVSIDALSEHGLSIDSCSKPLHLRNHFDPRSRFSFDARLELGVPIDALSEPELCVPIDALLEPELGVSIDALSEPELGVPIDALSEPEHGVSIDALSEPEHGVSIDALSEPEHGVPIDALSEPEHGVPIDALSEPEHGVPIDALSEPEHGVSIDALLEPEHGVSIDALLEPEHGVPIDALLEPEHGVHIDALSEPEHGVPIDALSVL
ncbi:uncharacterized protein LOC130212188 [Pseudoliparis swirei]|uniref:uncharacterized protein LOC130212188 n=1 Tax=Pseudoliparis swirei TaxID=2059687 RepID=UPI0024BE3DCD|nr:uncharacterized protein LOC130212188 [Pseudoliparis swirei]